MGDVFDKFGNKVGSVNAWSGIFDSQNKKVGDLNIFSNKVFDSENNLIGEAFSDGEVRDISGNLLCKVAFFGSKVKDPNGNVIGNVGIAGAPDPMPDMQWRGAAALVLLCRNSPNNDKHQGGNEPKTQETFTENDNRKLIIEDQSHDEIQRKLIATAKIIDREKNKFFQPVNIPFDHKKNGAYCALVSIHRDILNASVGFYNGGIFEGNDHEKIIECVRAVVAKWRKIENLDIQNRRDDWDDGHAEAIKWCFSYYFPWRCDV